MILDDDFYLRICFYIDIRCFNLNMFLKKCLIIIVNLNELINVFIYNIRIIKLIG